MKYYLKLIFVAILFSNTLNAQESFTKELKWLDMDTIQKTHFQDTTEIIEWGRSLFIGSYTPYVRTQKFTIDHKNIFISMVDVCSGIYCPFIYVYVEENKVWFLKAFSHVSLQELLEVVPGENKIVFKTKSGQIGELLIEAIN